MKTTHFYQCATDELEIFNERLNDFPYFDIEVWSIFVCEMHITFIYQMYASYRSTPGQKKIDHR